jgi:hypothetical protein
MTDQVAGPSKPEEPPKLSAQLIAWARTAVPAVVSTLGLSGLVSILGAAVLWSRFSAAGLPAEQAVGDQPTASLIVTGAASLVLYLVLGLLAVLVVYMLQGVVLSKVLSRPRSANPVGRLEREAGLIKARILELTHDIEEAEKAEAKKAEAKKAEAKRVNAGKAPGEVRADKANHAQQRLTRLRAQALDATLNADAVGRKLFAAKSRALDVKRYGNASALLVLAVVELVLVVLRTSLSWPGKAALGILAIAIGLGAVAAAYETKRVAGWIKPLRLGLTIGLVELAVLIVVTVDAWTLAPVATALLLALACFAVGRLHPRRFFWLGIAVFASVALFGATLTYSREVNAPSAQAAAVLLKSGCAVEGLWIGESSDRVFLARVDPDGEASSAGGPGMTHAGRIFSLESSQVVSESIGRLRRVPFAMREATVLRSELLAVQGESVLVTAACTATGQASDYFAGKMASFKGAATLHSGPLPAPLCLVRYFDQQRTEAKGGDPGANWWTTCQYNKALRSVALVRAKLALPKAWGERDARVTATIPAGTSITYLSGPAAKQCESVGHRCYEGGGVQVLFHDRDVNRTWFSSTECDNGPESAPTKFAVCRL